MNVPAPRSGISISISRRHPPRNLGANLPAKSVPFWDARGSRPGRPRDRYESDTNPLRNTSLEDCLGYSGADIRESQKEKRYVFGGYSVMTYFM